MAPVVQSRGRQFIMLPKGIRLTAAKVDVSRDGADIVLREMRRGVARAYDLTRQMPADMFGAITNDGPPQHRDGVHFSWDCGRPRPPLRRLNVKVDL